MITMAKTDSIVDFTMKFTLIISELQNLGEEMDEKDIMRQFLRATPSKFDALTLSLEQCANLDKVRLLALLQFMSCSSKKRNLVKRNKPY